MRALYDIDGGPGATWLALGEDSLVFYHRPSGGEFNRTRFRINEIVECAPTSDGKHACLRFRFANANFTLKCSLFDQPRLVSVARACDSYTAENPVEAPARLTPASAFCAGIHAVLDADGHVDPLETEWLCRTLPDPVAIEQGSAWYRVHGRDKLLATLPTVLNPAQRECLLVNQLSAIMSDSVLEPAEMELIGRFRTALDVSAERYEEFFHVIFARNRIAVFQSEADEFSRNLFASCLVALAQQDAAKTPGEIVQLQRVLNDTHLIEQAEVSVANNRPEDIAANANLLSSEQAATLITNLLALSMADGEIAVTEQEFIDQVRSAAGIDEAEYESWFNVLLTKHNLGVLAG